MPEEVELCSEGLWVATPRGQLTGPEGGTGGGVVEGVLLIILVRLCNC